MEDVPPAVVLTFDLFCSLFLLQVFSPVGPRGRAHQRRWERTVHPASANSSPRHHSRRHPRQKRVRWDLQGSVGRSCFLFLCLLMLLLFEWDPHKHVHYRYLIGNTECTVGQGVEESRGLVRKKHIVEVNVPVFIGLFWNARCPSSLSCLICSQFKVTDDAVDTSSCSSFKCSLIAYCLLLSTRNAWLPRCLAKILDTFYNVDMNPKSLHPEPLMCLLTIII